MHVVKTGLLCIPTYDEDAVAVVRRLLRQTTPAAVIVADQHIEGRRYLVEELLRRWCDEDELDLVLTIGGTLPASGPSAHEIAPEATAAVLERTMPGLVEAMRAAAYEETSLALLDRSTAGIRGRTLIVNLPAGAAPAVLFLDAIADVLDAVVAHLQVRTDAPTIATALDDRLVPAQEEEVQPSSAAPPLSDDATSRTPKKLSEEEFAEYLRRRSSGS